MAGNKEISLIEFLKKFGTEQACEEYLKNIRWPDGVVCYHCGWDKPYTIEGGKRYKCSNKKCYKKFSLTGGTIFHNSNVPLPTWFLLIYFMATNRKSISSYVLSRNLGVTQKTAWELMHKLRAAFEEKKIPQLSGTVEVDECFIGKTKRWSRWGAISTRKAPILGMIQRGGQVIIRTINDRTNRELEKIIFEHVKTGSTIYTDGFAGYRRLKERYTHDWVNHADREYVRGDVHTNTIENVWAFFKKNIRSGHHSISGKHVQRYCNEVAWKFNRRNLPSVEKFDQLLLMCSMLKAVAFKINRKEKRMVA